MIRLKRLYSETNLFDEVRFKNGLNIVMGNYSSAQREINGIGKSTLVRLIDYTLLSRNTKARFFDVRKFPFLKGHNVVLEFYVGDEIYCIKRWFGRNDVLFGRVDSGDIGEYPEEILKSTLGDIFFKVYDNTYCESKWFRSLIHFFIKDDLNHQVRKVPYNFLHQNVTKNLIITYNLYLIGLPNENIYQIEKLRQDLQKSKKVRDEIQKGLEKETGKRYLEIKSEIEEVRDKIQTLEVAIKEYDFIDTYKDIEERLSYLSGEISKKLLEIQKIQRKLDLIRKSYSVNIEVDVEESVEFYKVLKYQLGMFVEKTLQEVIAFRKAIADNRKKYLADRERRLKDDLDRIHKEHYELERERRRLYKILDSKGKFDIIKETYKELLEKGMEYHRLESIISEVVTLDEKIIRIEKEMSDIFLLIAEELRESSEKIKDIGTSFRETIRDCTTTSEGSYLAIECTRKKENPIDIKIDIPKSLSYGRERLKILAYDLTIFKDILNNNKPMPHFLIHDGVLHGIDLKTKIRVLNHIYRLLKGDGKAQYILTLNEGDVMDECDEESLLFNLSEHVIARYEDSPEKTIFKREF